GPGPVPISVRKIAEIPTTITITNTDPNLVQQPTSVANLQPFDYLMLLRSENTFTTKFNLFMANSHQHLSIDTHSNTTIKSLLKKSYTMALIDNQKPKSK
ncbi:25818_t:CDS:1, partial [Dentiscutata erythropus]